MRCTVCGGTMENERVNLPFMTSPTQVIVIKSLPAFECSQCGDTELDHATMTRVHAILDSANGSAEYEVLPFAA